MNDYLPMMAMGCFLITVGAAAWVLKPVKNSPPPKLVWDVRRRVAGTSGIGACYASCYACFPEMRG